MTSCLFRNLTRSFIVGGLLVLGIESNAAPTKLKMGVFLPMSGGTATFGQETADGVRLALDELKNSPVVSIDMKLEDEKSDVTDAANAVKKLINVDKVNVVVGTVASSNTSAAAPIAQAAKIPLLTPTSTNVNITKIGEYISRICFIDDFQGSAMAKFAFTTLKAKKAAIVVDTSSDYSQGLAKAFKEAFTKLGGTIITEVSYQQKDQDFSSQLTKLRTQKPDVVFAPGYYPEIGTMIKQAKTLGLRAPFLGGDGWSSPKLYELAGDAIVGNYFADHFSPDDTDARVQDFVKKFKAKFKTEPSAMAALGYDAVMVVADAVKRSGGKIDGKSLSAAINSTKAYPGVTGNITLDASRNASKSLVIMETQRNRALFKQRVAP